MSQLITGVPTAPPKNQTIKATLKATKARRTRQRCRVFEVKLDSSHLNQHTKAHLKSLFLEAKWLYNHILSQPTIFDIGYKLAAVPVKVKDSFELRELRHLSSHMKQSLIRRTIDNIKGLTRLKEKGHTIGPLRYKSCVKSIPLKQYGNTYKILNDKYIKIQDFVGIAVLFQGDRLDTIRQYLQNPE